jgi:hypothetical protein
MALRMCPVNQPMSAAHHQALRRDTDTLLQLLKAAEPADFGGLARRTSEAGERLVRLLWNERDDLLCLSQPFQAPETGEDSWSIPNLVKGWIAWAYERNQFFDLDSRLKRGLWHAHDALLRSTYASLGQSDDLAEFGRRCQLSYVRYAERLARLFRSLTTSDALHGRAAEYSAELQLELLGLHDHVWREPIVDLGCGVESRLVNLLRERGLSATGVERRATSPFVLGKDWFDVRFEPDSLGTIVSHLAFSLHFLHHHWHPGDRAYDYAKKYMELLQSLVPGGLFCYAPGLPFIECMLDPITRSRLGPSPNHSRQPLVRCATSAPGKASPTSARSGATEQHLRSGTRLPSRSRQLLVFRLEPETPRTLARH